MNERPYRSVDDRVIAGVCGGLARRFAVDPSLVRIGYVVVALLTGIVPLVVLYVILAAIVPDEPWLSAGPRPSTAPGPGAVPGWMPPSSWSGDPNASTSPREGTSPTWAPPSGTGPDDAGTPGPPSASWSDPAWTTRDRHERRPRDPWLGVIGGLVLVALGVYLLVGDRFDVDWSVVSAAALVALGVVVIVSAFVRPRR